MGNPLLQALGNFLDPSAEASPATAKAARRMLGQGEVGGNNKGQFVRSLMGTEGQPWCSALVSKAAQNAGEDVFGYLPMARQWINKGRQYGLDVKDPMEGDVAVWSRGSGSQGHTGVIDTVGKDGFYTIEGNLGEYPSVVKRVFHKFKEGNLLGFVRLPEKGSPTANAIRAKEKK